MKSNLKLRLHRIKNLEKLVQFFIALLRKRARKKLHGHAENLKMKRALYEFPKKFLKQSAAEFRAYHTTK